MPREAAPTFTEDCSLIGFAAPTLTGDCSLVGFAGALFELPAKEECERINDGQESGKRH